MRGGGDSSSTWSTGLRAGNARSFLVSAVCDGSSTIVPDGVTFLELHKMSPYTNSRDLDSPSVLVVRRQNQHSGALAGRGQQRMERLEPQPTSVEQTAAKPL